MATSPGAALRNRLSPRTGGAGRDVLSTANLPPESQFALKNLNVTVDGGEDDRLPASLTRADVAVRVLVSLEGSGGCSGGGGNNRRDEKSAKLAAEIQTEASRLLSDEFTADASEEADPPPSHLLKVYVVLASERSRLHRITLGLVGEPHAECLEWFLQSQDSTGGQTEIRRAGRVGGANMTTAQLCASLVEKVGVPPPSAAAARK